MAPQLKTSRALLTLLLLGTAITGVQAAAPPQIKVDRRVAATGTTGLQVTNVAGSVRVTAWDRPEVQVTGELGAGVERLDVLREGSDIVVKVVLPRGKSTRDANANLRISVPRSHRVEASTVSADVDVQGIGSALEVQTVAGDLRVDCACTDLELKSVSGDGDISAGGRATRATADTVSGDFRFRGLAGDLEVASISGDIAIGESTLGAVRVRSTSGDVQIDARATARTAVQVETVSGDSRITARGATGFTIDARSFSGEIGTCFGVSGEPTSKYGPGSKLDHRRGDGSVRVRVNSVSGDVTICDR